MVVLGIALTFKSRAIVHGHRPASSARRRCVHSFRLFSVRTIYSLQYVRSILAVPQVNAGADFKCSTIIRSACLKQTNRPVQGLVSIDRSKVAALISTTPRPRPKSSTNDLVLDLETVNSRFTTMPDVRYVRNDRAKSRRNRGSKTTPSAERRSTRLYLCLPKVRGREDIVACLGGILT